ncbi:MAG: response regulator [Candidatus Zixiibacteriota bacterium]
MASILIVDDEIEIRRMLRQMLEREGYTIYDAGDGEKAIQVYKNNDIDLVITDIIMPVKEGIITIFELRNEYPDVKIIAISGGSRVRPSTYLETAEAFGAIKTLVKPLDRKVLLKTIEEVLAE